LTHLKYNLEVIFIIEVLFFIEMTCAYKGMRNY
jgi:hypothetical protein